MYLRRKRGRGPWHLCSNCPNWPSTGYESTRGEVPEDEICKGCLRKQASGNCR